MAILATLCFICKDGKILLQRKANGRFGAGKWNMPGGKVKENESIQDAVKREVEEETGLKLKDVFQVGKINFFFIGQKEPAWVVHVFEANGFEGKEIASDEGELKWFDKAEIPFEQMWPDDKFWYPLMLNGEIFEGYFYYTEGFAKLLKHKILKVKNFNLLAR